MSRPRRTRKATDREIALAALTEATKARKEAKRALRAAKEAREAAAPQDIVVQGFRMPQDEEDAPVPDEVP